MKSHSAFWRRLLVVGSAVLLLLGLTANCWVAHAAGVDFPYLYAIGRGIVTGGNVYDRSAIAIWADYWGRSPLVVVYPPATGLVMLPFAALPFQLAKWLWFVVIEMVMISGVRRLVKLVAPRAGVELWMLCAAAVTFSSTLRWGMLLLQAAPLMLGLLCWFIVTLHEDRPRGAAAIAVAALAVKMTLALPFVGLLLLQRRFSTAAAAFGASVALNGFGFWRMGSGAWQSYRANVAGLEAFDSINSPDPWNVVSSVRTDWLSLFYGLSHRLAVSRSLTLTLTVLVLLWLLRQALRTEQPTSLRNTALFLPPLVCLGLLCVYHHHYDASLLYAPALLCYFVLRSERISRVAIWLGLPFFAICLVLPLGISQALVATWLGRSGVGLLKLSFPLTLSAGLLGSLIVLSRATARRSRPLDLERALVGWGRAFRAPRGLPHPGLSLADSAERHRH